MYVAWNRLAPIRAFSRTDPSFLTSSVPFYHQISDLAFLIKLRGIMSEIGDWLPARSFLPANSRLHFGE